MQNKRETSPAHEISGVNVRAIGIFIGCFVLMIAVILVLVWWMMGASEKRLATSRTGEDSPIGRDVVINRNQPLQPSPGHPALDWQDMAALQQAQRDELGRYGQIPGDPAHVRIPVARAMELLMEKKGLLVSPDDAAPASTQPYVNTTQPTPTENRT